MNNCYATGKVSGDGDVGGVVGLLYGGSVAFCYATGAVVGSANVGGVVGYLRSGTTINCVALNPDIQAGGTSYGRVAGYHAATNPSVTNIAGFVDMTHNGTATEWAAAAKNGAGITAEEILEDPSMGNRFKESSGWTLEPGKLPGLLGKTVDMPAHLRQ